MSKIQSCVFRGFLEEQTSKLNDVGSSAGMQRRNISAVNKTSVIIR